jgi:hypothetical protein
MGISCNLKKVYKRDLLNCANLKRRKQVTEETSNTQPSEETSATEQIKEAEVIPQANKEKPKESKPRKDQPR